MTTGQMVGTWAPAWLQAIGAIAAVAATFAIARSATREAARARAEERAQRERREEDELESLSQAAALILHGGILRLQHAIGQIERHESSSAACRRCASDLQSLYDQMLALPTERFRDRAADLIEGRMTLADALRFCDGTANRQDAESDLVTNTLDTHRQGLGSAAKKLFPPNEG